MSVLILEDELLIALDVERIVLECGAKDCRIFRKQDALNRKLTGGYDPNLLVIDYRAADNNWSLCRDLVSSFVPIIILTTDGELTGPLIDNPNVVAVVKPFGDSNFLDACRSLFC